MLKKDIRVYQIKRYQSRFRIIPPEGGQVFVSANSLTPFGDLIRTLENEPFIIRVDFGYPAWYQNCLSPFGVTNISDERKEEIKLYAENFKFDFEVKPL